jgi:hypothetical protein
MRSTTTTAVSLALLFAAGLVRAPLAADDLLTQLGDAAGAGRLESTTRLHAGSVPISADQSVTVEGTPTTRLEAVVRDGRLELLRYTAPDDSLVLTGRGAGPDVVLTRLEADASGAVTSAEFHGRGVGSLSVGLFNAAAKKRVLQLRVHTDLARLLRGDVLAAFGEPLPAAKGVRPEPAGSAASAGFRPSFLDLVDEVRILELRISARPGQRLAFGDTFVVETGGGGEKEPFEVRLDEAVYQPGQGGAGARWSAKGRIDGSLGPGSVGLATGAVSFRSAELLGGRFSAESPAGLAPKSGLRAGSLRMELGRSAVKLPGGIDVQVGEGSRLGVSGLVLEPDGSYLGRIDFSLLGGTGEIRNDGERLALSNARISSSGLLVRDGRATGPLALDIDYRLVSPHVEKHPDGLFQTRTVPLEVRGPLSVRLTLADVGARAGGSIVGEYSLKIPWKPVEAAAVEAMRVRWTQELKGERALDFSLEPRAFGPCGPRCFVASFALAAEPRSGGKGPGRLRCALDGRADLVIDAAGRALVLKSFAVSPRCKGAPGGFASLGAALLTGTFAGATLLRLPPELPFPVETVRTGSDFVRIDGTVTWKGGEIASASPAPATAAPAVVAPLATPPPAAAPRPAAAAPVPAAVPSPTAPAIPVPAPAATAVPAPAPAAVPAPSATPVPTRVATPVPTAPTPAAPAPTVPAAPTAPTPPAAPPATAAPGNPDMADPGGEVSVPSTNTSFTKVGAGKCGLCHKAQFASWANSGHARRKPPLDCEACHGPGSEYRMLTVMKNPVRAKAAGLVVPDAAFCGKCHTGTPDPGFLAKAHVHRAAP